MVMGVDNSMIHKGRVRLLPGSAADINTQVRTSQANAGALPTTHARSLGHKARPVS
jgi:hypothetical protein